MIPDSVDEPERSTERKTVNILKTEQAAFLTEQTEGGILSAS